MSTTPRFAGHSSQALSALGWDESFSESFAALSSPGDVPARVLRADLGACVVATGEQEEHLPVSQELRADGLSPTTGDWVVVRQGHIVHVLERRTAVLRASTDESRAPQVLAANAEFVLVAEPLGERWRPRRIERLLVVAWQSGALPVVVLTKADRADDLGRSLAAARKLAPGAAVHAVSARDGTGVAALAAELAPGTTAVILGRSGAGKSTLANLLAGGEAGLDTGETREDGKGRHTTVRRELVRLANGALLIDTPGLRAIGLTDSVGAIAEAFSDIEELAASCRFNDCAHDREPDCAVTAAVTAGDLATDRLASYRALLREQLRLAARSDRRLRAARAAELRALSRQLHRTDRR